MKKIVFFDDDPKELKSLRKKLSAMSIHREMAFVADESDVMEILRRERVRVIVAGFSQAGTSGSELLSRVKDLYPQIIRIVISRHSDQLAALELAVPAHQYLLRPCDSETLKSGIARACSMQSHLADRSILDLVSRMESLPSLPTLYAEVLREVNSTNCSVRKVGEIISKDVAISAKILQLANSAFYGTHKRVTNIVGAVLFLGLETIKALLLSLKIFSHFKRSHRGFSISDLWDHSLSTGMLARSLATQNDLDQGQIDEAFIAGLIHDVGKLILWDRLPRQSGEIARIEKSTGCRIWEAERQVLGTTHAQIGAYLMGLWGLSESIVNAIAYHHAPGESMSRGFGTLAVVHLANALQHDETSGHREDWLDHSYLEKIGFNPSPG